MVSLRILVAIALLLVFCDNSLARRVKLGKVQSFSNKIQSRGQLGEDKFSANPPALAADYLELKEDGEQKCVSVLDNDNDYEGNLDPSSLDIYEYPTHGWAEINNKKICYTPKPQFHGSERFSYSVCDTLDRCEVAVIRVVVKPINDAPTVRDDSVTLKADAYSITIDVLENDEDVDGAYVNHRSLKVVQKPCHGVATITKNFEITYTPNWNQDERYFGEDMFIYQICDNEDPSLCSYAKVYVDVLDKCIACEKCNDLLPTFNDHRNWLDHVFERDIISDL